MALANVALTDTFDYWRTVTNSLVVALNDNILFFKTANANTVSITATGGRQANIFMNVMTTSSFTDVSPANIASTLAVNTVHSLAYSWVLASNSNTQISVASANAWTNAAAVSANAWANTVGIAANNYASILVANNAVGANNWANTKLANTSGMSFAGNLTVPGTFTSGAIYAPIVYDTDNNSYFCNPAGTSNLNRVDAQTSMYAPIYYDITDVNFYVDPNSISRLNDLRANVVYLPNNTTYRLWNGASDPSCRLGNIDVDQMRSRGATYGTIFYDDTDNSWYADPNGRSRMVAFDFATNNWNRSTEGWNRIYFENLSSTYLLGGTTGQWYIRFGTANDGTTRSIMEGGGNFYTNGNVVAYWSDERLKKNITKIENWREIISGINGYWFEWNDLGKKILDDDKEVGVQAGLIAQEVKAVLPQAAAVQMMQYKDNVDGQLVPKDDINYDPENPYLTVREEKIIPVLVEAIKGLMAEIDELKKKLP